MRPLANFPAPATLTIEVKSNERSTLSVKERDAVLLGQVLTQRQPLVHSPVSGTVISIQDHDQKLVIVIQNDARDARHSSVAPIGNFATLTPDELRARLANGGIVGLGGASFPTATKLRAAADRHATFLILNGAECEPFISCDDMLMRTSPEDVILGAQALLHAGGATSAIIAIEDNKPLAIAAINAALLSAHDSRITLQTVPTRYPTGGERQLVKLLLGKEVPSGGIPPDIGVLIQNVATAWSVARLIRDGTPAIERVVTITGSGVNNPGNVIARYGTPISELIRACGGYTADVNELIMGGSMMGISLESDEISVTATTNCIIAATPHDFIARQPEMPCIRCGDCSDVCPAHLLPQQLYRYARIHDHAALTEHGLSDCIECGCCDYVCPSNIPLTSTFIAAKQT